MKHDNLWYSPKKKHYYMSNLDESCNKCGALLVEKGTHCLFARLVGRKHDIVCFYCLDCALHLEKDPLTLFESKNLAILSDDKPKDCLLLLRERMSLKDSKDFDKSFSFSGLSTFDVADIAKLGGTTIDKTVYAGRELGLALNSRDDIIRICNEHTKKLSFEEGLNLLDDLAHAVVYKSDEELVRQIEHKKLLE
jgi:hypothetical protein